MKRALAELNGIRCGSSPPPAVGARFELSKVAQPAIDIFAVLFFLLFGALVFGAVAGAVMVPICLIFFKP